MKCYNITKSNATSLRIMIEGVGGKPADHIASGLI
mgnify:FL=1